MATLTAVEGDPFAPPPKMTPVQGDPFAAPKAAAPPVKLTKVGYNPFRELAENYGARVRQGEQETAAGFREMTAKRQPGEDPGLAEAGRTLSGGLKTASGVWDYLTSPVSAAADTIIGKPMETISGKRIPKTVAGDAATAAMGMLAGGAKPAGVKPRAMAERIEKPVSETPAAPLERRPAPGRPGTPTGAQAPKLVPVEGNPFKPASEALARGEARTARTLAEAPKPREREIVSPGPSGEGGPVVGGEADPIERVDNALYRLGGHATADKLEAQHFLRALPKELSNPKLQERLYDAIERRLVDPKAEIPVDLKPAMDAMRPYYEEQTAIINRLRERGDPELEPYLEDQGYVARRVKGYSPLMDQGPGADTRDPLMGQRSLAKTTQAQKQRTAGFIATDAKGKPTFWRGEPPETDLMGKPWKSVRQATTQEIEANTGVRYHKNAVVNTVDNVLRLRRVERNVQVLDEITRNLKDEGLAFQKEWRYRDPETKQTIVRQANGQPPEGFVELPHIPQLRGWTFDKKVAEVLKDYRPGPQEPIDAMLSKVNRALTASLFITPIPHAMNVAAHWAVGRGWDWIKPVAYARMMRTGTKAATEVLTGGPKYRQMLREGSGLLYGDTQVSDFHKFLFEKAGNEVTSDPKAVDTLAKAAGMPVAAVKAAYSLSNRALWAANDIFMLQRQMELEAKGMSPRKAILEAEKDIPNYRIPPQVLGFRALAQVMKSQNVVMFGRYKYGQLKAWGSMFKEMMGPKATPEERFEAFGKFVAAMTIANVAYPMADAALKKLTGNEEARLHRSGPFSMTDAAWQFVTGQKDFAAALSSFMIPAPASELLIEGAENRDAFTGQPMIDPNRSPEGIAVQAGERAAEKFYPAQLGLDALKPGGVPQALGKLAGIDLPREGTKARREKYKGRARKMSRKQEAKDPVMQKLRGLTQ